MTACLRPFLIGLGLLGNGSGEQLTGTRKHRDRHAGMNQTHGFFVFFAAKDCRARSIRPRAADCCSAMRALLNPRCQGLGLIIRWNPFQGFIQRSRAPTGITGGQQLFRLGKQALPTSGAQPRARVLSPAYSPRRGLQEYGYGFQHTLLRRHRAQCLRKHRGCFYLLHIDITLGLQLVPRLVWPWARILLRRSTSLTGLF